MRTPFALALALQSCSTGSFALRQIPDSILKRYQAAHPDTYGPQGSMGPAISFGKEPALPSKPAEPGHYWPHAAGRVKHYSVAAFAGPKNLSESLRWSWTDPRGRYHNILTGGPLIDDKKNIYITALDGIRKFSEDGKVQWYYNATSPMVGGGSLLGRKMFGVMRDGNIFAVDIDTGKQLWTSKVTQEVGQDPAFVEAHMGTVITAVDGTWKGGNRRLVGLDSESGVMMWQILLQVTAMDLMPVFPDDETAVFQDSNGNVYRVSLLNGSKVWARHPKTAGESFARGGVTVDTAGGVYSCSNYGRSTGSQTDQDGGILRKYRLTNGEVIWEQKTPWPCNSWPVISQDGHTVIVPTGALPDLPTVYGWYTTMGKKFAEQLHRDSMRAGKNERSLVGKPLLQGAFVAYDTKNGQEMWRHQVKPYGGVGAAGDEEGFFERRELGIRDLCQPSHWSQPIIDARGTIIAGRLDGSIYSLNPKNMTERVYETGSAPQPHSLAFAPGLMVYADCDSVYVFNGPKVNPKVLGFNKVKQPRSNSHAHDLEDFNKVKQPRSKPHAHDAEEDW